MKSTLLILTALLLAPLAALTAADFYVAPEGSDANRGTIEKPFATLPRARDAVRLAKRRRGRWRAGCRARQIGDSLPTATGIEAPGVAQIITLGGRVGAGHEVHAAEQEKRTVLGGGHGQHARTARWFR